MKNKLFCLFAAFLATAAMLSSCVSPNVVIRGSDAPSKSSPASEEEPARIELNVYNKTVAVGESFPIFASIVPVSPTGALFTYSADNENTATVSEYGIVTAVAPGDCTVTVRCEAAGLFASLSVHVTDHGETSEPTPSGEDPTPSDTATDPETEDSTTPSQQEFIPIEGLELVGPTDVVVGLTYQFTVKVTPENATETYTLHNSNDRYSVMTEDGLFTPTGKGITTITVETEDRRITDSITVYISNNVASILVSAEKDVFEVGETVKLHADILPEGTTNTGVWWVFSAPISTGDCEIRSSGYDCYVTATKAGGIKITCGTNDRKGVSKTYSLTAKPSTKPALTLDRSELTLEEGASEKLKATLANHSGKVVFSSASEMVATVSSDGTVTGVMVGQTEVTASTEDGTLTAVCLVTVKERTPVITVGHDSLQLEAGEETSIGAVLKNASGQLSYSSSAPEVAAVDASGNVTGVSAGSAEITVSYNGAESVIVKVTVTELPPEIRLSYTEKTMTVGDEDAVEASLLRATGTLTYESSAPQIVSVDPAGSIKAESEGVAVITVSYEGAESVTLTVTVTAPDTPEEPDTQELPENP